MIGKDLSETQILSLMEGLVF